MQRMNKPSLLRKVLSLALVCLLTLSVFSGCQSDPKILKFGGSGWAGLFNPVMSDNVYDSWVSALLFEALVNQNAAGEIIPDLATWTLSEDKLTYTFTLKNGIKFSDGKPMTTADVEFTYKTMAHPDYIGPRAYSVSDLQGYDEFKAGSTTDFPGIKVIDEKNISFTFKEGLASPANIECFVYGIMPKHYYEFDTMEKFLALNEKPLGSGLFTFDSWKPKEFIKLNKNAKYWDSANAAKIDGVLMSEVPSENIISALQTGQIDIGQPSANKENVDALKGMSNVSLQSFLGNGYTYLCFNTLREPFDDVRVRQALIYALDRKSFITACYQTPELASVGMAPISPSSWAFPDPASLNPYDFDMNKAAALMDEAGWTMNSDGFRYKDGKKLTVGWLVYSDSPWPGILSSMAADTWKQLGVELNIELMDFVTVQSRTQAPPPGEKDFDIYTMGFSLSLDPDPTGALFDYDAFSEGGFNASGYLNEESQALIKQGKSEFDQAKRKEIYSKWAQLMNEEIPTIIVAYRSEIWGVNNRIKNCNLSTYFDWQLNVRNMTIE